MKCLLIESLVHGPWSIVHSENQMSEFEGNLLVNMLTYWPAMVHGLWTMDYRPCPTPALNRHPYKSAVRRRRLELHSTPGLIRVRKRRVCASGWFCG